MKTIITVFSGKGGVGKSTVSVNLAVALAQQGARVGLFDADVHGPNIPNLLGLNEQPRVQDSKLLPIPKHGIYAMSIGLLVGGGDPLIWRGPMISKAINELLEMTAWPDLDYLIIDLPPGCLTADTLIFTPGGPVPISEIREGDLVYSFVGHITQRQGKVPRRLEASLVERPVVAVIPQGKAAVYELKTSTRSIKGTADHPVLVLKRLRDARSRGYRYALEWAKLGTLQPGDILLMVKKLPDGKKPLELPPLQAAGQARIPRYSSEDFMRLLGYLLGDGFIRKAKGRYWGVWFSEPEGSSYRVRYERLLQQLFRLSHIYRHSEKFAALSAPLAELCAHLGFHKHALEKRVPSWVFTMPHSQQLAFLEGYCDADGHHRAPKHGLRRPGWMVFESPNRLLISDVRALCIYAGLKVGNLISRTRTLRVPSTQQLLTRTFWGFEANAAAKTKTGLYGAGIIRGATGQGLRHEYVGFERVKQIRFVGWEEVYDLHVEGEHNFVASGLIVHNTGDAQLGLAQDVKLSGAIAVTTPQEVALADVRRGIGAFEKLGVKIIGIVENMAYYLCPKCGHREYIFGQGGGEAEAQRQKIPLLGQVPLDPKLRAGGDAGVPIVIAEPSSPAAQEFHKIAKAVQARFNSSNAGA
ncbi:MAG: P-loop NTPase [Candidatus Bipolaricaulota bacterium]|nr:P-loop NTPase [Candidatus Bipolaricaulota bacterium]